MKRLPPLGSYSMIWRGNDRHFFSPQQLIRNVDVEHFGWMLVQSLWQFALLALLAFVVVRTISANSASAKYWVFVTTMALMVAAPIVTWVRLPTGLRGGRNDLAVRPVSVETRESGNVRPHLTALPELPSRQIEPRRELPAGSFPHEASFEAGDTGGLPSTQRALRPWMTWIVFGWCVGVVLCSLRPILGWRMLSQLKRVGVSPVSDEVQRCMNRVSERLGLRKALLVLQSTLAKVPVVVGYMRPVILLPVSLATSLPASQLEALLAHEIAHIQRHDFVVNLLQTMVETLFFYHPCVWWLSRRIRTEREHCCDDRVVSLLGDRIEYSRALVAVAEMRGQHGLLALGASDGTLLSRIRRIVGESSDRSSDRREGRILAVVLCVACVIVAGLSFHSSGRPTTVENSTDSSAPVPVKELAKSGDTKVDDEVADATAQPKNDEAPKTPSPSFTDPLRLTLKREDAYQGRWFFIDLDRGQLAKPPLAIEFALNQLPEKVLRPEGMWLRDWLVDNSIDLMLFVVPSPMGKGSPDWRETIRTWSIRTQTDRVNGLLKTPHVDGESWLWDERPELVVDRFAREDDAVHITGFVTGFEGDTDVMPDSPDVKVFRTADNVVGFYLLEHIDLKADSMDLRIVQMANATAPLQDVSFGGELINGNAGAAMPPHLDGKLFLTVVKRQSRIVEFDDWLKRVDGFDPKTISVIALDKNKLRVQGLTVGLTMMTVTDRRDVVMTIPVEIVEQDPKSPGVQVVANFKPDPKIHKLPKSKQSQAVAETEIRDPRTSVVLGVGEPHTLQFPHRLKSVNGYAPEVLKFVPLDKNKLRIQGLAVGKTTAVVKSASLQDEATNLEFTIDIEVKVQSSAYPPTRESIRRMFAPEACEEPPSAKPDVSSVSPLEINEDPIV